MSINIKEKDLPKFSVIVPSYNQGIYLEETLLSIINQNYPNLELIVIDGGSTDNSVEIIRKHEDQIAFWISEKDRGQSHAINKGIQRATGEWIAMLNSDDCYLPGALHYIFEEVDHKQYDFLHGNCFVGKNPSEMEEHRHPANDKIDLFNILLFFYGLSHIIPSQSVFIRKDILNKAGLLNEDLHYCMDLDLYCRIYLATTKRFFYEKTICFYRFNELTKTGSDTEDKGVAEAIKVAGIYQDYLSKKEKKELAKTFVIFNGLQKIWNKEVKVTPFYLFKLFKKAPNVAMKNKLFVHLTKRALKAWPNKPEV